MATKIIEIGHDLNGLKFRRQFAQKAVQVLDRLTDAELSTMGFSHEQRLDSMDKYKGDLAEIDRQITEITGTPPPVVVGLKTAVLFPKVDKASILRRK